MRARPMLMLAGLLVAGCAEVTDNTRWRVTLDVDGEIVSDDVVSRSYMRANYFAWSDAKGRVLTFPLRDGRVVVLPAGRTMAWRCAPRRDGTRCADTDPPRYRSDFPEGYIFDPGSAPRAVTVFQLEPSNPKFNAAPYAHGGMPEWVLGVTTSRIALVSATLEPVREGPRDRLDKHLPAFRKLYELPESSPLRHAATMLNIPRASER